MPTKRKAHAEFKSFATNKEGKSTVMTYSLTPRIIVAFVLAALVLLSHFQSVLGQGVIGYINSVYYPGTNLIANPVDDGTNDLADLFFQPPDGTTVSFWDPATRTFDSTAMFTAGLGWSQDQILKPGEGALLYTAEQFTNTFEGQVLQPDGSPVDDSQPLHFPVPDLPTGTYLLSCKAPANLSSPESPVFSYVLGRGPQEGEQFTWFDVPSQSYQSTTFKSGAWDNGAPALPLGTSAFFRVYAAPTLRITIAANHMVLSWPIWAPDFVPEASTNLSAGTLWTSLTNGIVTNATSIVLTNSARGPNAFFRLRRS